MVEEWKDVVGQEGRYEVSNLGRVRSVDRLVKHANSVRSEEWEGGFRGKILVPLRYASGHLGVSIGRGNRRRVHHLVLEAFVGPRPEGMECRHLNGDPANNRLDNIAWGTRLENAADRKRHGTEAWGEKNGQAKLTEEGVRLILTTKLKHRELAERLGVSQSCVNHVRSGQVWKHVEVETTY